MKDFKRGFVGFFDKVFPDLEFAGFLCAWVLFWVLCAACFIGVFAFLIKFFST
jgi:hypothetical protein